MGDVHVALATAFDDDLAVDYAATARLARHLAAEGVGGFLVAGTTGEGPTLTDGEICGLIDAVRAAAPAQAPVLACVVRSDEASVMASLDAVLAHDPDGVLVPPLASSAPGDLAGFYQRVKQAVGDVALLAYHFPARYPPGLQDLEWADLAVDGFKDSSGDAAFLAAQPADVRSRVYVGAAALAGMAAPSGCRGAILASANADPAAAIKAYAGDEAALAALVAADADIKRDFPRSLKQAVGKLVDFPLTCRLR